MTEQVSEERADQATADLAREWALRAVLEIVRQSSGRRAPRPVFRDGPDLDVTVGVADPIASLQAATKLKFAARQLTLDYARRARGADHSWEEIGVALGLERMAESGVSVADAAFDYAAGTTPFGRYSLAWVCGACRRTVIDRGPQTGHCADAEDGHADRCPRLAAAVVARGASADAEVTGQPTQHAIARSDERDDADATRGNRAETRTCSGRVPSTGPWSRGGSRDDCR